MEDDQIHEWSRHYDSIQWTVTGILTSAISVLLAYSYDCHDFNIVIALLGIVLTVLTVYFAASFRSLRRKLHHRLKDQIDIQLLRSSSFFKQWGKLVLFFIIIIWLWVALIFQHYPEYKYLLLGLGIGCSLFMWELKQRADCLIN